MTNFARIVPVLSSNSESVFKTGLVFAYELESDHGVYMLAEIFMRDDMLQTWKHGHVASHNYFSSLCFRNPVLLYVVQDQF